MLNKEVNEIITEIKRWIWIVIPTTLCIEVIHFFLRGNFKFIQQYFQYTGLEGYLFGISSMTVLPALFVVISGSLHVDRRLVSGLLLFGGVLSWGLVAFRINTEWVDIVVSVLVPLGIYVFCISIINGINGLLFKKSTYEWVRLYWHIVCLSLFLAVGISSFLEITPVFFPGTYDYLVHALDGAYFYPAEKIVSVINNSPEFFKNFLTLIYNSLGWVFLPMVALVFREKKSKGLNIWRMYIYSLGLAMLCYVFIPISGPIYAFGPQIFPEHMDQISKIPQEVTTIPPALRNGMPSMHFTSAVSIVLVCAALRNKWYFFASIFFMALTVLAAMGFGEHYLIDMVVALTYSVTISVLLVAPKKYLAQGNIARILLFLAGLNFGAWMFLIKFAALWLAANTLVIQILTILSLMLFFGVGGYFIKAVWHMPADDVSSSEQIRVLHFLPVDLKGNYWTVGVFFASGAAGLLYEVVFAKALAVTFGASSLATNTVLATYMGGMALGAWIGSRLAERNSNPLRLYAFCEAFIGLYALLTPSLFKLIQDLYVNLVMDQPADAAHLTALRLILGAAVLGPVTLMMGATFPFMFARLRQLGITSERAIAPLYAANVVGAAFGALFAGYALIPAVGKTSATYIAALVSLLVALYAFEKIKQQSKTIIVPDSFKFEQKIANSVATPIGVVALVILAIGGCVTMGLEVLFMHMLAVVAGNSVYAFGLMLSTFLLGLGVGSAVGERVIAYLGRERVVVLAQCGLAIAIIISSLQWDALAKYFANFGPYEASGIHITFSGREMIRALVCAVAMMPAAFFIGMSYPACMGLATDWLGGGGREVSALGKASGINTLGNISGVLLTGFLLLPILGSRTALLLLVFIALALGVLMAIVAIRFDRQVATSWEKHVVGIGGPLVVALGMVQLFPSHWDLDKLSEGSNVYFYPQEWGHVIDHAESTEGGLTTVARSDNGLLTLLTNGKFQGNNSEHGEMVAQKSFALIPLLHVAGRELALVIGYGTGMTPRVVNENGFKSLDIAELSRDMVLLANRHFENINHAVTEKSNVNTYYTDGRNFLLTQSKKYDLISIEISSIWFAGAANLYNKEFYELVSSRLKEEGVLQQWIQLHHMQPLDFLYAIESMRSAFKYVWFYVSGGQGVVIASNSINATPGNEQRKVFEQTFHDQDITIDNLKSRLAADPVQIDAMLSHFDPSMHALLSTDNNLYLEYSTPKGNSLRGDTVRRNIELLISSYQKK